VTSYRLQIVREIRFSLETLLGLVLMIAVLLTNPWQQVRQSTLLLTPGVVAPSPTSAAIHGVEWDFQHRWFGSPALWQPPPIDNTDISYFEVKGSTQRELITSIGAADICKTHGPCAPDPANPGGITLGLAGAAPAVSSYVCYSPRTTTVPYRENVLLPRWSPLPLGGISVELLLKWNAFLKVIYVHEAGHVAIDIEDIAALNDQAHQLPSCQALFAFWDNPHVFDKLDADQNAYHARLRADCRPQIGCMTPGWMGW
jgi:predicted secreted Zn-dependent protease